MTRWVLHDASLVYADGFSLAKEVELLGQRPCRFMTTAVSLKGCKHQFPVLDAGKKHFLYVGRWEHVKGLDVLLDAWRLLVDEIGSTRAVLHIVGQGQGLESCVRQAQQHAGVRESVRIEGWLSRESLVGFYYATDCVVIPSRKESIPVVLTEAMDAGKPLIVTDVGDMGDLARRYQLGEVVPPESPGALKAALARFIRDGYAFNASKQEEARRLFDLDAAARSLLADAASLRSVSEPPRRIACSV